MTENYNVLMIEDNDNDMMLLERAREKQGSPIRFTNVKTLKEALDLLDRESFSALLLDLELPDTSAYDTFTKIKNHAEGAPIVICSNYIEEEIYNHALANGVSRYFIKIASPKTEVIEYLEEICRNPEDAVSSDSGPSEMPPQASPEPVSLTEKQRKMLSHDLRTCLGNIKSLNEIVSDEAHIQDPELVDFLKKIGELCDEGLGILNKTFKQKLLQTD